MRGLHELQKVGNEGSNSFLIAQVLKIFGRIIYWQNDYLMKFL